MGCVAIPRYLGPIPLDVVMEEKHKSQLEITRNPIEFGADVTDHAYVQPKELKLRAVHGQAPGAAGIVYGLPNTRAAAAYQAVLSLQALREPFTVVTGLRVYTNMLIEQVKAKREPETGSILDFEADLLEVIIVGGVGSLAGLATRITAGRSLRATGSPAGGDAAMRLGRYANRGQISGKAAPLAGNTVEAARNLSLVAGTFG